MERELKNIQIVDSANNCTYNIFAATEQDFDEIFPNGNDVEFIEDYIGRVGESRASEITSRLWNRPIKKSEVCGIHGTLYYQLLQKKRYFPTKKESEMVPLGTD
jgi:hypothetical protein